MSLLTGIASAVAPEVMKSVMHQDEPLPSSDEALFELYLKAKADLERWRVEDEGIDWGGMALSGIAGVTAAMFTPKVK